MEVFSNIVLNLQAPAFATVFSPQGQTLSRSIQASLMDGATPWEIPSTALCVIRYAKPDGTKGFYDTLEDDSLAYSYNGNVVTFGLATQALTVPDTVLMQLDFYNSDGEKLTTFTFRLIVAPGVFADSDITSSDYFNVLTAKIAEAASILDDISADALKAEGFAVGEQDGAAVESGSPYYQNNSKYFSQQAAASATQAGNYAQESTAQLPTLVSNWLGQHITQPTTPAIDNTLSVSGAAADSAKTGALVAPVFSELNAYSAGDYVLHDGQMYQFTTDHAAGAWAAAEAQAVDVAGKLSDLSRQISDGNLNQHIIIPLAVSAEDGGLRANRSALSVITGGGIKAARNSGLATLSYGFYAQFDAGDVTGHKIYVKISGVDVTGATHYSTMRVYGSYNATGVSGLFANFDAESFSQVFTPAGNVNQLSVLCDPGSTVENGDYFTVDYIQFIDLTAMFGAGYEPTVEEFEAIYTGMPYVRTIPAVPQSLKEDKTLCLMLANKLEKDYEVVDSISGLANATKDYVLVLHNNSQYGDGGPCWFEYLGYATDGGYERADGGKMFPMLDQGALISNPANLRTLWSVMTSYLENSALVYGQDHTLFADDTTNEIDCSSFVSAVLNGIPYGASKYSADTNTQTARISAYNPSKNTALATAKSSDMAQYFAEHKWLHKMPTEMTARSVLQQGDILFARTGQADSESRYLKIGHLGIVLATMPTSNRVIVAQCGRFATEAADSDPVGKISTIELSAANIATYFPAFGRIPYYKDTTVSAVNDNHELQPILIPNLYINESGAIGASGRNSVSELIDVIPGTTLTYTGALAGDNGNYLITVAEYDKNLNYISIKSIRLAPVTLSADTKYIRIQFGYATQYQVRLTDIANFGATLSNNVPMSITSSGKAGQIAYDSGYVYVCVADNTWKRASLETW